MLDCLLHLHSSRCNHRRITTAYQGKGSHAVLLLTPYWISLLLTVDVRNSETLSFVFVAESGDNLVLILRVPELVWLLLCVRIFKSMQIVILKDNSEFYWLVNRKGTRPVKNKLLKLSSEMFSGPSPVDSKSSYEGASWWWCRWEHVLEVDIVDIKLNMLKWRKCCEVTVCSVNSILMCMSIGMLPASIYTGLVSFIDTFA